MRALGFLLAATLVVATCAACGTMPPPTVVTNIECPQPAAETLAAPPRLGQVPPIPADPAGAVGVLSGVIEADRLAYDNLVARHVTLINHGTQRCRWTP